MDALTPNAILAVDAVILAVAGGAVCAAMAPGSTQAAAGAWALPGALLGPSESVEDGLSRMARTKLMGCFGGAFRPFGFSADPGRDPRGRVASLFHAGFLQRSMIGRLEAGSPYRLARLRAVGGAVEASVDGKPVSLAYDHAGVLASALGWLRLQLPRGSVTRDLLGDLFTLSELREVYEAVYGVRVPQAGFDYAVRSKGLAEPTSLRSGGGMGRPSVMHRPPTSLPSHWEPTP